MLVIFMFCHLSDRFDLVSVVFENLRWIMLSFVLLHDKKYIIYIYRLCSHLGIVNSLICRLFNT
jgi:hypothetical protein